MDGALPLKAFARTVGRSVPFIRKLCTLGVLPRNPDGTVPADAGAAALAAYADAHDGARPGKNHRVGKARKAATTAPAAAPDPAPVPSSPRPAAPRPAAPRPSAPRPPPGPRPDYEAAYGDAVAEKMDISSRMDRAKLIDKTFKAKLSELEFRKRSAELVPVSEAQLVIRKACGMVAGRLRSLPPRLAGVCEGRPAKEIEGILERGIDDALEAFSRMCLAQGPEQEPGREPEDDE